MRAAESIRKMLFAMVRDVRVILIKLADKLHNMRTLEYLGPDDQKRVARQCMDIYCPLAGRLGLYRIRTELEDLAMKYLHPRVYLQLKEFVAGTRAERDALLHRMATELMAAGDAADLEMRVARRAKHFYSIFQKMKDRGHSADEIHDLLGLRVICTTPGLCYEVLGLVHKLWPPIEGRFKDYIAMPKSNHYQSLHTTVMAPGGSTIEVQIRTAEMHETAENGIAAHWLYKARRGSAQRTPVVMRKQRGRDAAADGGELSIINKLRDWQGARAASTEFLEEIKRELLRDSIYVFTPKGDIIELPRGSTPIDFAYHIHTEVGNHCVAAKANGVIMPLSGELKNTQVIEITTSTRARPHLGLAALGQDGARPFQDPPLADPGKPRPDHRAQHRGPAGGAAAGAGHHYPPARPPAARPAAGPAGAGASASRVGLRDGNDAGLLIRLARCCRPTSDHEIVGYISRGQGITVHRASCANVRNITDFSERSVEVAWETPAPRQSYSFAVTAGPDARLFSEIERIIRSDGGTLVSGYLEENAEALLTGRFTVEVKHRRDFGRVTKHLKSLDAVNHCILNRSRGRPSDAAQLYASPPRHGAGAHSLAEQPGEAPSA